MDAFPKTCFVDVECDSKKMQRTLKKFKISILFTLTQNKMECHSPGLGVCFVSFFLPFIIKKSLI